MFKILIFTVLSNLMCFNTIYSDISIFDTPAERYFENKFDLISSARRLNQYEKCLKLLGELINSQFINNEGFKEKYNYRIYRTRSDIYSLMKKYFEAIQDLSEAEKWAEKKSTICDLCRLKAKYYLELGNANGFADEIMKIESLESESASFRKVGEYFESHHFHLTDRETRNKIRRFVISLFEKNVIAYSKEDKLYYKFEDADAKSTQDFCFCDACWELMDSEECAGRCEWFAAVASPMAAFIPNKKAAATVVFAIGAITIECKQCCRHGLGSEKCFGLIKRILLDSLANPNIFSEDYL